MDYRRLTYHLPPALEEDLTTALWEAGTLGTRMLEEGGGGASILRLEAYFPAGTEPPPVPAGVELVERGDLPAADWLAPYRERARPFAVGRSLFVDPREPGEAPPEVPAGRRLLRLPARGAFGTGGHESTRLALELLEELAEGGGLAGRRLLDVGTGTGVLAFAALAWGAGGALGLDADPAAPFAAAANRPLNGLFPQLLAGTLAALAPRPAFDVAALNILPEHILPELPLLPPRLAPGAAVIFSGWLRDDGPRVLPELRRLGFEPRASRCDGEWMACRCRLEPAP